MSESEAIFLAFLVAQTLLYDKMSTCAAAWDFDLECELVVTLGSALLLSVAAVVSDSLGTAVVS